MVFEQLKAIIVDQWDGAPDDVSPESRFADDLGAGSRGRVELILAIERSVVVLTVLIDLVAQVLKVVENLVEFALRIVDTVGLHDLRTGQQAH